MNNNVPQWLPIAIGGLGGATLGVLYVYVPSARNVIATGLKNAGNSALEALKASSSLTA